MDSSKFVILNNFPFCRFPNLEDKHLQIKGEIEARSSNGALVPVSKPVIEDELYHSSLQNEQDAVVSCLENLLLIVVKSIDDCSSKQNSDLYSDLQQEYFKRARLPASTTSKSKVSDCQERYSPKLDINIPKVSSCLCEDIYVCTDKTDPASVVTKHNFEKSSQIAVSVSKSKPGLFVNETASINDLSRFDLLTQNCDVKGEGFNRSFGSFEFPKNSPLSSDSKVASSFLSTNCTTESLLYDSDSHDACVPDFNFGFSEVENSPDLSIIKNLNKKETFIANKISKTLQDFRVKDYISSGEAKIDNFLQCSALKKDKTNRFVSNSIVSHSNSDKTNLKCITTNVCNNSSEDDPICKINVYTSDLNSEDKSISYSVKDSLQISSLDELSNVGIPSSLQLKKEMPQIMNDPKTIRCDQRVPTLFEDFSDSNEDEMLLMQTCMLTEGDLLNESNASAMNNVSQQNTSSNKDLSWPTLNTQNLASNCKLHDCIPYKFASVVHQKNTFHSQKIGKREVKPVTSLQLHVNSDKKSGMRLKNTECVTKSCHLLGDERTSDVPASNTQGANCLPILNSVERDSHQTAPIIKEKQFHSNFKGDSEVTNHDVESFVIHDANSDAIAMKNKLSDAETISKLGGVCSKKAKSNVFCSRNRLFQKVPLKCNVNKFTTYSGLSQSDLITKEGVFNPLHFESIASESALASQYLGKSTMKAEEKVGVFQPNELLFSQVPYEHQVVPRSCNLLKQNSFFSETYPLHVEEILQPPVFQDYFYNVASYPLQRSFPKSYAAEKPQSSKWTRFKNEDQYVPDRKKFRRRWLEEMVKQEKSTPRELNMLRTPNLNCHITETSVGLSL